MAYNKEEDTSWMSVVTHTLIEDTTRPIRKKTRIYRQKVAYRLYIDKKLWEAMFISMPKRTIFVFDTNWNTTAQQFANTIDTTVGTNGGRNWKCLNVVPLGTAGTPYTARLGAKIALIGMDNIWQIRRTTLRSTPVDETGRILIVYSQGQTAPVLTVPPTLNQLLRDNNAAGVAGTPNSGSFQSRENAHIFLFKRDFTVTLERFGGTTGQRYTADPTVEPHCRHERMLLGGLTTEFTASTGAWTDISKGGIFMFCISDTAVNGTQTWQIEGESRLYFANI